MGHRNILTLCIVLYLHSQLRESEGLRGPGVRVVYRFYQFVVAIAYNDPSKTRQDNQFCLGSIITLKHVLTTASCLVDKNLQRIVVYSDSRDLNQAHPYVIQSWTQYDPNQENFSNELLNLEHNDIAVAKLNKNVGREYAKKRPFGWSRVVSSGELQYLVVGWGFDDRRDTFVYRTKYNVKILDPQTCERVVKWKSVEKGKYFCTYGGESDSLSTSDYGGPLLFNDGHHEIVGVTIRQFTPSETGFHLNVNLHANVSYYKHFLKPYRIFNTNE